jgi:hypothetical protein
MCTNHKVCETEIKSFSFCKTDYVYIKYRQTKTLFFYGKLNEVFFFNHNFGEWNNVQIVKYFSFKL